MGVRPTIFADRPVMGKTSGIGLIACGAAGYQPAPLVQSLLRSLGSATCLQFLPVLIQPLPGSRNVLAMRKPLHELAVLFDQLPVLLGRSFVVTATGPIRQPPLPPSLIRLRAVGK